ncbi:MAG: U32 family peptidase [Reinekea sp.]|jgi:collagenase-like PrtC family protease|nr:U32 family peptidase [Reinekea sp.]MDX1473409.1 U32 family peptidase [Reinekea sp.]
MNITLGPIPFYWPKQNVIDFYEAAQDWPVDRIILGETVCSKRREMRLNDWQEVARRLQAAGKEVALSTLALLEAESELKALGSICAQDEFIVEANDLAAVELLFNAGKPFLAGPYLNIYNPKTLDLLCKDGLRSWTLPVELSQVELADMLTAIQDMNLHVSTEVMVHGYLPLALSARCFTARALDRPKDECKRICIDYPTGIPVDSQEHQRLFTMNGIQTLSGDILDLRRELPAIQTMGVNSVRIVPSQYDMANIISAYAAAIKGDLITDMPPSSASYCNGYWYGDAGMAHW